jgi:K+-sensing histidine kinase KdpD
VFIMTEDTWQSLSQDQLQEMFDDIGDVILKSSRHLDGLLWQIKSQKAGLASQPKPLFLMDLVREANSPYLNNQLLKLVSFHTVIPCNQLVYADKQMLQLINSSILNNLTRYAHPGSSIGVTCSVEDDQITVAFTAQGDEMTMDHLKEWFAIRETTNPGDYPLNSAGVALHICEDLIGRMNGKLWVESVPGEGNTFYYSLPLKKAEPFNLIRLQGRAAENMEEIKAAEILRPVDITDAIVYYGMTELLDTIGEEQIRLHLDQLPQ